MAQQINKNLNFVAKLTNNDAALKNQPKTKPTKLAYFSKKMST